MCSRLRRLWQTSTAPKTFDWPTNLSEVEIPEIGSYPSATLCMWIKLSRQPSSNSFASLFHSDGWDPGDLHWRVLNDVLNGGINGGGQGVSGRSPVAIRTWYHVAITVDGPTIAYYLNGVQDFYGPLIATDVNMGGGLVGAWKDADDNIERELPGDIDDVRIYDRALTAAEIAGLAGRSGQIYRSLNE